MSHEVRPGYKQTELGVIPEDWECAAILSIARLESGHTPSKRRPTYWNGDIPWVSLHDTDGLDRPTIYSTAKYITDDGLNNSSARLLPAGTVVFSRTATVGKSTVMGRAMATSQDFANYICGPRLDNRYLVYLFRGMGRVWQSLMAGSIHNTIYMPAFKALKIVLPPLKEQKAIVEALSDIDSLIESLEQLVAKKRHLKQGTMQELLTGKKRLPGFQVKVDYKHSEAGMIPGDWDVVSMGQVSECLIGLTYRPLDVRDYGTLVLRSSNVQNGKLAFEDNVFVEMEIPARAITKKDDILICVRNGSRQLIGKCALIDDATAGCAFGAFMSVLRSESAKFLFFQFQSSFQKRQIEEVMGATINQITNSDLARFKVIWPSDAAERNAIAEVLVDMDAEIAELEAQLTKTRTLKQGMMHKLLTGEIRLI